LTNSLDHYFPASSLSFIQTRARNTDCDTSKTAAKHATTGKAATERLAIIKAVKDSVDGLTAMEIAKATGIEYISVQRRLSECGLRKSDTARRDGRAVWVFVSN
jgi:Tfp pilus assembly protein PilX